MFALVNVTSAESSPPSPPSTPPAGYLQTDHFTGYMNHTTLSAARVHAAAVTEAGQSNQPALSLNSSTNARRLRVTSPRPHPHRKVPAAQYTLDRTISGLYGIGGYGISGYGDAACVGDVDEVRVNQ